MGKKKKTTDDCLKKIEEQIKLLFDDFDGYVYVIDVNTYELVYTNSALQKNTIQKIYGWAPADKQLFTEYWANGLLGQKGTTCSKWEYHDTSEDRYYDIQRNNIQWFDGREVTVFFATDTTKNKLAFKELEDAHELLYNLNKELENKVEERTLEVQALIQQKDEFIYQLGHDLKTPLMPLINLLPMVLAREQDAKSKERLEVVMRCVEYMKELVLRTLHLAEMNSSTVELIFEPISLYREIQSIIDDQKALFDNENIEIMNRINKDFIVHVEKTLFQELVHNILSNAIKFTGNEKDKITIDATMDKDCIFCSIKDTGIGMKKEDVTHIFNEFYKADQSRHQMDSHGLGLAISKRIVEIHGGSIWAESSGPGKGMKIIFSLPFTKK